MALGVKVTTKLQTRNESNKYLGTFLQETSLNPAICCTHPQFFSENRRKITFLFCIVITGSVITGSENVIISSREPMIVSGFPILSSRPSILFPPCHLDQARFHHPVISTLLPLPCHLDQALARGEISLSRATPCKLRCLDSARHDRGERALDMTSGGWGERLLPLLATLQLGCRGMFVPLQAERNS